VRQVQCVVIGVIVRVVHQYVMLITNLVIMAVVQLVFPVQNMIVLDLAEPHRLHATEKI